MWSQGAPSLMETKEKDMAHSHHLSLHLRPARPRGDERGDLGWTGRGEGFPETWHLS